MDNGSDRQNVAYVNFDDEVNATRRLPKSLRNFILFEAPTPINAFQLHEAYALGYSWAHIETMVRKFCADDHRSVFGGVHPQLDPPRRVW